MLLDSLAEGFAEPMVKTLISRALNKGDVTAAELVLRHIWPVRKGAPVQIDIPKITSSESVLERHQRRALRLEIAPSGSARGPQANYRPWRQPKSQCNQLISMVGAHGLEPWTR